MRSKIPPCPGKMVPLSLTLARRFSLDSKRSPIIPMMVNIEKATGTCHKGILCALCSRSPKNMKETVPNTDTIMIAAIAPSQLFFGLIVSASLWRPKRRPTKKAVISLIQTVRSGRKNQARLISFNQTSASQEDNKTRKPDKAIVNGKRAQPDENRVSGTNTNQKGSMMVMMVSEN